MLPGIETIRATWISATENNQLQFPQARAGHIACAVDKREEWGVELLVIHGGVNAHKEALDDLAVLQCEQQEWLQIEPPSVGPAARAFHAAAVMKNKVYIFGGHVFVKQSQKLHQFNDLWELDTDTWQWHRQDVPPENPQPIPRDRASLVSLDSSRLLLFGGADAGNKRLDDCWIFDTLTATWTEVKPPGPRPRARCHASLFTLGNRVMLFGGDTYGASSELWSLRGVISAAGTEAAGTSSGTSAAGTDAKGGTGGSGLVGVQWTLLQLEGNAPTPRRGQACAQTGRWTLFMGGLCETKLMLGMKKQSEHQSNIFILDRKGDTLSWRDVDVTTDTPLGREKHTLTALSSGRMIMFGGTDGQSTLGDAWWLDLEDVMLPPELVTVYGPGGQEPQSPTTIPAAQHAATFISGTAADNNGNNGTPAGVPSPSYWNSLPAAFQQGVPALATAVPAGLTTAFSSLLAGRERWGLTAAATPGAEGTTTAAAAGGITGNGISGSPEPVEIPREADADALQDPRLLDLGRRVLGAASVGAPAAPAGDSFIHSLQGLGVDRREEGGVGELRLSNQELVGAARGHLASCDPEELKLKDVGTMLTDYRRLSRIGWAAALRTRGPAALAELEFLVPGRYSHLVLDEVRMKDVAALQVDYRQLLTAAAAVATGEEEEKGLPPMQQGEETRTAMPESSEYAATA